MCTAVGPSRATPPDARRRRHVLAACLLASSVIVPMVGYVSLVNGMHWGLGEGWWTFWPPLQFAATPLGNIVSLLVADRRKLWVKLNYVMIALWVVIAALLWFVAQFVVITK